MSENKYSIEQYIQALPERTYNCEPFGIKMMPCNRNEWSVCWYSHFSNKHDDRIPVFVGSTIHDALQKAYDWFSQHMLGAIKPLPEPATPTAQWQKEAEEMSLEQLEGMVIGAEWVYSYYQKLKDRLNAEHTAHMEQVQREVDEIANVLTKFLGYGHLLTTEGEIELNGCISRLRSITQTKTDKG